MGIRIQCFAGATSLWREGEEKKETLMLAVRKGDEDASKSNAQFLQQKTISHEVRRGRRIDY